MKGLSSVEQDAGPLVSQQMRRRNVAVEYAKGLTMMVSAAALSGASTAL